MFVIVTMPPAELWNPVKELKVDVLSASAGPVDEVESGEGIESFV